MSISPELTGGAGFTFEDATVALYLSALLGGTTFTGLSPFLISRVSMQQEAFGHPLDDLIVEAIDIQGGRVRLSLQVKRALTLSSAKTNTDFRDVVHRSWHTVNQPGFLVDVDKVGAVTGFVADGPFRGLTTVCELARASDADTFSQRFGPTGSASQDQKSQVAAIRSIIQDEVGNAVSDSELHLLLRHFLLIKFDLLHEGATDEAAAIRELQRILIPEQVSHAGNLWIQLKQIARDSAGRSATFSRARLVSIVTKTYRLNGAAGLASDIAALKQFTQQWLSQQDSSIDGYYIKREALVQQAINAIQTYRLTLIKGIPGTGKTVLLHKLVEQFSLKGSTLLLPANRLSGKSWVEFAKSIGITASSINGFLTDIAATGSPVLFIDGIDRLEPTHRHIVTDLLFAILNDPELADWRVIATARDAGIEPLRNWMPQALFNDGGFGHVKLDLLSDDEAEGLAVAVPVLRPLLFGNDSVRTIARRPFFASVLARGVSSINYDADFSPSSEIDLINAWWSRGGYDAENEILVQRQRALLDIAKQSASELGKNARISRLGTETVASLSSLQIDGLIQPLKLGHTLQFSHDIFFEWSFYHLLVDKDEQWIDLLSEVGEPPALSRVVELLAQANFQDPTAWKKTLKELATKPVRPQWVRAWLMGPFLNPNFETTSVPLIDILCEDEHYFLAKLFVWFQAEKTTPNPGLLSGTLGDPNLTAKERIQFADILSLPSDFAAWRRLLDWTFSNLSKIPEPLLPDLVEIFETWQVPYAMWPNYISEKIIRLSSRWLLSIEERQRDFHRRFQPKQILPPEEWSPFEVESQLRRLLLNAARAYPDAVTSYLESNVRGKLREEIYEEIVGYSILLSETHPELLLKVVKGHLLEELPDDAMSRWRKEAEASSHHRAELRKKPESELSNKQRMLLDHTPMFPPSFSHHDLDGLCLGGGLSGYFPASPLREPFGSAFKRVPDSAMSLVHDLSNHAVIAWRQLHKYHIRGRQETPIPLILEFPWGKQEFWGDKYEYSWARGVQGPHVLECGLMALEAWAISEIDKGADIDALLKKIIKGNSSIAILGVAAALTLYSRHVSSVTLPIVTCQRLWNADLRRWVNESTAMPANLIGFNRRDKHYEAVAKLNAMPIRRDDIRSMVPLFVLSGGTLLSVACRAVIDRFIDDLPFEYEEERDDAEHVEKLLKTAQHWVEWGHAENYRGSRVPGQENTVIVELEHPKRDDPEVIQTQQNFQKTALEAKLWGWVDESFSQKAISQKLSIDEAVASVCLLVDRLADERDISNLTHGIVAGVAAVVICLHDPDSRHRSWALSTLQHYRKSIEVTSTDIPDAIIPWHPKIFLAKSLAALLRNGQGSDADKYDLYALITHPLYLVAIEAVAGTLSCWDEDSHYAWCGLNLGLHLSRLQLLPWSERHDPVRANRSELLRRETALGEAISAYHKDTVIPALTEPLPFWSDQPEATDNNEDTFDEQNYKRVRSDQIWLSDFAIRVLDSIPLQEIMASKQHRDAYLYYFERLVIWTIESLSEDEDNGAHHHRTDLFSWERKIGVWMANLAGYMDANEVQSRFLAPVFDAPDPVFAPISARFAERLSCMHIMDADEIRPGAIDLLMACLERTLKHKDFKRTGYRAGEIGEADLVTLIETFLFISTQQKCEESKRFANWQWNDLSMVLPVIDRLVTQVGWMPTVARCFITLCDRAAGAYPADIFASQMYKHAIHGYPKSWKSTLIPAGVARNIQTYADQLYPIEASLAKKMLHILDALVDLGDRRSAALQGSEAFRGVRIQRV